MLLQPSLQRTSKALNPLISVRRRRILQILTYGIIIRYRRAANLSSSSQNIRPRGRPRGTLTVLCGSHGLRQCTVGVGTTQGDNRLGGYFYPHDMFLLHPLVPNLYQPAFTV